MVTINVNSEGLKRQIADGLGKGLRLREILAGVGRDAQQQVKKHLRAKDRSEPNKLRGKRTHFWAQMANATQATVSDDSVTISVSDSRFAQKLFGGRIVAKNARMLTIPVSPEAHGKTTDDFKNEGIKLFVVKTGRALALARKIDPKSKFLQVEYLLKNSVDQKPDPTALPDMGESSEFTRALVDRAQKIVDRQTQGPTTL